jgi:hypothetical protein
MHARIPPYSHAWYVAGFPYKELYHCFLCLLAENYLTMFFKHLQAQKFY